MITWICVIPVVIALGVLLAAILRANWRSTHCDYCHEKKPVVKPMLAGWPGEGTWICSDCYQRRG